ncbi:Altered inheritance of mitochondria protein 18, mitochondrial [Acrodontium crateriforme]|uniref:Altered inheritance of mitochondria protein 18, mitochondrial n=1 Tax=Acrodontium crateriforme TaxID=150365 RepID=A0AAQ3RAD4_9PEZI|nr:Altered inheritance of mitochondria protein 18, mitochondrial [Acrodontium crateriforme]
MAAPTRRAMRLLSPRLQCASIRSTPCAHQLRCVSSRYSNPGQRATTSAPIENSSFLGSSSSTTSTSTPAAAFMNPLDARAGQIAALEKRQFHYRRMRFAGMGILLSMLGLSMIIYNLDLDSMEKSEEKKKGLQMDSSSEANATFQGKEVHVIGAGKGKRIVAHGPDGELDLVETGTSTIPHFPRTIRMPIASDEVATPVSPVNSANDEEYTLVGLGIRSVLWVQVYVVGLYIRTADVSTLQEKLIHGVNPTASTLVPAEKEILKKKLLDPEASREIWTQLLEVPGLKTAWRIAPTRNTDFGHLRDGFVNGINARIQETRRVLAPEATVQFDSEEFGQSVQGLKSIFTGGKAPKGSVLLLSRNRAGALDIWFQPKPVEGNETDKSPPPMEHLGSVQDERIARLIWMGYVAGDKVSSKSTREGVVDGCVNFASRPVGSVETMVV